MTAEFEFALCWLGLWVGGFPGSLAQCWFVCIGIHLIVVLLATVFLLLHFWSSSESTSLLLSSTAPYPQGPGVYLCPSSTPLSCGSLHLKSRLLSESSLTPHHSSLVSPVLRKSVSFSEELFLAASGRITLCQLFFYNPFILNHLWKHIILYHKEWLCALYVY